MCRKDGIRPASQNAETIEKLKKLQYLYTYSHISSHTWITGVQLGISDFVAVCIAPMDGDELFVHGDLFATSFGRWEAPHSIPL